ncbi:hypothetical protein MJD09_19460 [bacterium]|nr:hypothetical protein [bacterium]
MQISGGGTNSFTGTNKEVVVLSFQAIGSFGATSPLGLDTDCSRTYLTTLNFNDLCGSDVIFKNGDVRIVAAFDVDGYVNYYNQSRPGSPTRLDLTGASQRNAASDSSGYFVFSNVARGDHTLTPSKTNDHRGAHQRLRCVARDALLCILRIANVRSAHLCRCHKRRIGVGLRCGRYAPFLSLLQFKYCEYWRMEVLASVGESECKLLSKAGFQSLSPRRHHRRLGQHSNAVGQGEPEVGTLRLHRVVCSKGEVRVPLSVEALAEPIQMFAFSVQYDTGYVAFEALERRRATSAFEAVVNVAEPGQLHVAAAGLKPVRNAH